MSQVIEDKSEESLAETPRVPHVQDSAEKEDARLSNNDVSPDPSNSNQSALLQDESPPVSEPEQASKVPGVQIQNVVERKRPKIVPRVEIIHIRVRLFRCRICSEAVDSIQSLMKHIDKVHNIQVTEPPRIVPSESRNEKEDQENISKLLVSLESKPRRPRSRSSSTSSNNSNSRSKSVKRNESGEDEASAVTRKSKSCAKKRGKRPRKAFDPDDNKNAEWSRCTICFMDFSESYRFEDHMRMHAQNLLLQCEFCGMSFLYQYTLNIHLGIPHNQVQNAQLNSKTIISGSEGQSNIPGIIPVEEKLIKNKESASNIKEASRTSLEVQSKPPESSVILKTEENGAISEKSKETLDGNSEMKIIDGNKDKINSEAGETKSETAEVYSKTVLPNSENVLVKSEIVSANSETVPGRYEVVPENSETVPGKSEVVSENSESVPGRSEIVPENSEPVSTNPELIPTKENRENEYKVSETKSENRTESTLERTSSETKVPELGEASFTGMDNVKDLKYKCAQEGCGASFANRNCLLFHTIRHDGLHRCPTCEKSFERQPHLRKHIQRSHTHKELSRPKKPKGTDNKGIMNLDKVTSRVTFFARGRKSGSDASSIYHKCPFCNQEFKGVITNLRFHIQRMHNESSGARPFTCPSCPLTFTAKAYLVRHLNYFHGIKEGDIQEGSQVSQALNVRPYSCPQCPSTYSAKFHLDKHLKIAHGGGEENGSSSSSSSSADEMEEVVIAKPVVERRPFKCDQCPRAFTAKQNLTTHMHLFHGNKDESTGTGTVAKSEELVARPERPRPFKCSKCAQAFTAPQYLTRHFNNQHKERRGTAANFKCGLPVITRKRRVKVEVEGAAASQDTEKETKDSTADRTQKSEACDKIQEKKSELKTEKASGESASDSDSEGEVAAAGKRVYVAQITKDPDDNGMKKAPYFCPACPDKTFCTVWNVNRHIRIIHQGIKEPTTQVKRKRRGRRAAVVVKKRPRRNLPGSGVKVAKVQEVAELNCSHCTMTFISQSYLDRHLRSVHNEGQEEGESKRGKKRKVAKDEEVEEESGSDESEASSADEEFQPPPAKLTKRQDSEIKREGKEVEEEGAPAPEETFSQQQHIKTDNNAKKGIMEEAVPGLIDPSISETVDLLKNLGTSVAFGTAVPLSPTIKTEQNEKVTETSSTPAVETEAVPVTLQSETLMEEETANTALEDETMETEPCTVTFSPQDLSYTPASTLKQEVEIFDSPPSPNQFEKVQGSVKIKPEVASQSVSESKREVTCPVGEDLKKTCEEEQPLWVAVSEEKKSEADVEGCGRKLGLKPLVMIDSREVEEYFEESNKPVAASPSTNIVIKMSIPRLNTSQRGGSEVPPPLVRAVNVPLSDTSNDKRMPTLQSSNIEKEVSVEGREKASCSQNLVQNPTEDLLIKTKKTEPGKINLANVDNYLKVKLVRSKDGGIWNMGKSKVETRCIPKNTPSVTLAQEEESDKEQSTESYSSDGDQSGSFTLNSNVGEESHSEGSDDSNDDLFTTVVVRHNRDETEETQSQEDSNQHLMDKDMKKPKKCEVVETSESDHEDEDLFEPVLPDKSNRGKLPKGGQQVKKESDGKVTKKRRKKRVRLTMQPMKTKKVATEGKTKGPSLAVNKKVVGARKRSRTCRLCSKQLSARNFRRHFLQCVEKRKTKRREGGGNCCGECGHVFTSPKALTTHLLRCHGAEEDASSYPCTQCHLTLSSLVALKRHHRFYCFKTH